MSEYKNLIKTKTYKKKYNKKTLKNKTMGGAPDGITFIGAGSYGCVYLPPLLCTELEDQNHTHNQTDISKLMLPEFAKDEYWRNIYLLFLNFDIDFSLHMPPPSLCTCDLSAYLLERDFTDCRVATQLFESDELEENLLIFQNGGLDFWKTEHKEYLNPKNVLGEKGFQNILQAILKLQEKGFVHCDIKSANIVTGQVKHSDLLEEYPDETERLIIIERLTNYRLIDFGLLALSKEIHNDIGIDRDLTTHNHTGNQRQTKNEMASIMGILSNNVNYENKKVYIHNFG
jgi:serine/threonine protein kinase